MQDIFSDLSKYGLDEITDVEVFESEEEKKEEAKKQHIKKINPMEVLYDRSLLCPVCNRHINAKTLKSGKVRLERTELDLRPVYNGFEPSLYDVIVCNLCGYSSLNRTFKKITPKQIEMVREKISCRYRGTKYPDIYTYEIGIERFKLALLNTIVVNGKNSEKAYLCLKIAWLYRGWAEELLEEEEKDEKKIKECNKFEMEFISKAFEGFDKAIHEERFPTMGFDESTMEYLLGELARKLGEYETAQRHISRVLSNRNANPRLKDKARDVKELIIKGKNSKNKEDE